MAEHGPMTLQPGCSPPWVLLRGLTREAGHWGGFPDRLQQALGEGARVILLDLPGNGALNGQPSPWRVQDMLQACRSQLLACGLQPPYRVLAMSLGAMVAAEWMRHAPQELASAVLINTSLRPFSAFYRRLRPRNYAALLRLAWNWRQPLQAERLIHALTSRRMDLREQVVPGWAQLRAERPVSRANALRQLAAAARYRAGTAAPAVPLLLLGSAGDGLVHAGCTAAIARAWGCAQARHPTAGHDLPLDAPGWVVQQVCDWVAGGPAGQGR